MSGYIVLTNLLGEVRTVGMINGMLAIVRKGSPHQAVIDDFVIARQWSTWAITDGGEPNAKIIVVE